MELKWMVRGVDFASNIVSIYDYSIGFRNCSDIVVYFVFILLFLLMLYVVYIVIVGRIASVYAPYLKIPSTLNTLCIRLLERFNDTEGLTSHKSRKEHWIVTTTHGTYPWSCSHVTHISLG